MCEGAEGNGDAKLYKLSDLKAHTTEKSCFLLVHGKVYDVTDFLDEHPGGYDIILNTTGRDATEDFEEIGHSNAAREMLDKYLIGNFEGSSVSDKTEQVVKKTAVSAGQTTNSDPGTLVTAFKALLPLLIILVAAYFALGKK
mmetsp:Transcript_11226/g.33699  ORF Transcript_11226/g.33699 Transcript_11226/m.33699 type:complete len:142 (-) Transcript_11226:539-964(-)